MQKLLSANCIILFAVTLSVLFPSLLASSLMWRFNKRPISHERWHRKIANHFYSKSKYKQIVYLESNQVMDNRESNIVPKRYESYDWLTEKVVDADLTPSKQEHYVTDYSYDDLIPNLNDYNEDNESDYYEQGGTDDEKKIWKASFILGSIGLAFSKWGSITISPLFVVQDTTSTSTSSTTTTSTTTSTTTPTTTSTSTTSTTPTTTTSTTSTTTTTPTTTTTSTTTTTPTTITSTTTPTTTTTSTTTTTPTTTTTTIKPITCSTTTTATTGTYKTIRTPGTQVAQCLSITVAAGSQIQITCTAVYTQAGTYTTFYENGGTTIIANRPTVNQVYTTTDNTLVIESLAGSSNGSTLCCT